MQDDQNDDVDGDVDMDEGAGTKGGGAGGWKEEYLQWWFDFLNERGGKGVTKDTWVMVCTFLMFIILRLRVTSAYSWYSITKFFAFIRSIDANFSNYNADGA